MNFKVGDEIVLRAKVIGLPEGNLGLLIELSSGRTLRLDSCGHYAMDPDLWQPAGNEKALREALERIRDMNAGSYLHTPNGMKGLAGHALQGTQEQDTPSPEVKP